MAEQMGKTSEWGETKKRTALKQGVPLKRRQTTKLPQIPEGVAGEEGRPSPGITPAPGFMERMEPSPVGAMEPGQHMKDVPPHLQKKLYHMTLFTKMAMSPNSSKLIRFFAKQAQDELNELLQRTKVEE